MKPPMFCPVCTSLNKNNRLILYQINLTKAVYLCEDKSCGYPRGHNWIEVNRSYKEIPKDIDKFKKSDPISGPSENNGTKHVFDDFSIDSNELAKIISEFENISNTIGSATPSEFEEEFFDMEQFEKDFFSGDLFNDSNEMDKLDVKQENQSDNKVIDNKTEMLNNTNINCENLKPKILNMVTVKPPQIKIEQKSLNTSNGSNDKKIKVIVHKDPGCNISQEQIQEILKKLPPSNGKTIVINLKTTSKLKK